MSIINLSLRRKYDNGRRGDFWVVTISGFPENYTSEENPMEILKRSCPPGSSLDIVAHQQLYDGYQQTRKFVTIKIQWQWETSEETLDDGIASISMILIVIRSLGYKVVAQSSLTESWSGGQHKLFHHYTFEKP